MARKMRHNIKHKYSAKPTVVDGIRFDSQAEARYYSALKLRVAAGEVIMFLRQTKFHLPGGTSYSVDFQEFHADGTVHFIDVKGFDTAAFKKAKKQVEALYPIEIEVVKK